MNALQLGTATAKDGFLPRMPNATARCDGGALPKIPNQILVFSGGTTSIPVSGLVQGWGSTGHIFIGIERQAETLFGNYFVGYALEAARSHRIAQKVQEHKNSDAIKLLTTWLADDANGDEQKETFNYLKEAIDEDRSSSRKLFK